MPVENGGPQAQPKEGTAPVSPKTDRRRGGWDGRGRWDNWGVRRAEERPRGPIPQGASLQVPYTLGESTEQEAEGDQIRGGGDISFHVEVINVVDKSHVVGTELVPPGARNVGRVKEVVAELRIKAAGKVTVILPQTLCKRGGV